MKKIESKELISFETLVYIGTAGVILCALVLRIFMSHVEINLLLLYISLILFAATLLFSLLGLPIINSNTSNKTQLRVKQACFAAYSIALACCLAFVLFHSKIIFQEALWFLTIFLFLAVYFIAGLAPDSYQAKGSVLFWCLPILLSFVIGLMIFGWYEVGSGGIFFITLFFAALYCVSFSIMVWDQIVKHARWLRRLIK